MPGFVATSRGGQILWGIADAVRNMNITGVPVAEIKVQKLPYDLKKITHGVFLNPLPEEITEHTNGADLYRYRHQFTWIRGSNGNIADPEQIDSFLMGRQRLFEEMLPTFNKPLPGVDFAHTINVRPFAIFDAQCFALGYDAQAVLIDVDTVVRRKSPRRIIGVFAVSNSPNMFHARRLGIGSAAPTTKELMFISCDVGKQGSHVEPEGIRGIRGHQGEQVVDGTYDVGGPLVMEPTPDEWDTWLPYILGGGTNPNFTLAENQPEFFLDVDKGQDIFRYSGMRVNTWEITSSTNALVRLSMDLQGKTETPGITFPAISGTLTMLQCYIHHNLVLTIGGVQYPHNNLTISGNNFLMLDRHLNSQSRTDLPAQDRVIQLSADFPNGDEIDALYNLAVAGLAGSAVWTNGGFSLGLTFPKLQTPANPSPISSRTGEMYRRITFSARRSGSNQEMAASNDSTV